MINISEIKKTIPVIFAGIKDTIKQNGLTASATYGLPLTDVLLLDIILN